MRQILLSILLVAATSQLTYAQGFLETTSGKCYWSNKPLEKVTNVTVNDGSRLISIATDSIVLYEDIEYGATLLQADKIRVNKAEKYNNNPSEFFAARKKVYIPIASDRVVQRAGSAWLAKQIMEDNHWIFVGCAQEADFILEYVFDDRGKDKAYLRFSDNQGNTIKETKKVAASDWVPTHAGEESAEKLYKKIIKKVYAGKW